jgi:hypothetical protein
MSSLILGILETTNEPPAGLKVAQARKGVIYRHVRTCGLILFCFILGKMMREKILFLIFVVLYVSLFCLTAARSDNRKQFAEEFDDGTLNDSNGYEH